MQNMQFVRDTVLGLIWIVKQPRGTW